MDANGVGASSSSSSHDNTKMASGGSAPPASLKHVELQDQKGSQLTLTSSGKKKKAAQKDPAQGWGSQKSIKRGQTAISLAKSFGGDVDGLEARWQKMHTEQHQRNLKRHSETFRSSPFEDPQAKEDNGAKKHVPHHHTFSDAERALMNSYESLDYDVLHSEVYEEYIQELNEESAKKCNSNCVSKWLVFAVIGCITGTLAFVVAKAVEAISDLKFEIARGYVENDELVLGYLFYALVSVGLVGVAVCIVAFIEPVAAGSGIPELKAYLNGTNYLRLLRMKTLVCKLVGVTCSVSGGLIIGKEGPMAHSGAVMAANLSHMTGCKSYFGSKKWLFRFRNDRDKRDFVSGGAAAGVAAAFGAPIGGVLFALEEAASYWSVSLTWMCMFCSMLGTFSLNLWKIEGNKDASFGGLISFGPPETETQYKVWETPFYLALAIFGGCFGALFNHLNAKLCHWRRDNLTGQSKLKVVEALSVAFLTATFAFWLPALFSSCRDLPKPAAHTAVAKAVAEFSKEKFYIAYQCNATTQYNPMATSIFGTSEIIIKGFFHNEGEYDILSLFVYTLVIFALSCITYGIAVPSGLFVPCILMGCGFGRIMGEFLKHHLLMDVKKGPYALMGAVAMLGGVSRMTISLTVILLETTQNMQFLLPIMLVLTVSKWVGDFFNISLYDLHVELKCMPFVESYPPTGMEQMKCGDISTYPVISVPMRSTVGHIVRVLNSNTHGGFPVTNNRNKMVGFILRNHLSILVNAILSAADNGNQSLTLKYTEFATTLQSKRVRMPELEALSEGQAAIPTDLSPYVDNHPLTVHKSFPVTKVYTLFRSLGLRHLVVVDNSNNAVGILTRKELMTAFDRDLF